MTLPGLLPWLLPIIVGIATFFLGRAFERNKVAQASRLLLLQPIEAWTNQVSRLVSMIGDDITAVGSGLPGPVLYDFNDRREGAKRL